MLLYLTRMTCDECGSTRHYTWHCPDKAAKPAPKSRRRKSAAIPVTALVAPVVVEDIGARLRRLREDRGESLQQAAEAIGCTKPHLWELEKGSSANPSLSLLRAMASHYGVTVAQLIGETA